MMYGYLKLVLSLLKPVVAKVQNHNKQKRRKAIEETKSKAEEEETQVRQTKQDERQNKQ
jgi:hypothetical protein